MDTLVMNTSAEPHIERTSVPEWSGELAPYRQRLLQSEKMSAAGNLLAGIVHELNNPLTTILGFSELLLHDGRPDSGRLEKIHAEAERCVRIVQNVLRLARTDNSGYEVIDVNESIRRTVELAEYQIRLNCIDLNLALSGRSPKVLAQAGELTQVFLNAVTNAIQAISGVRASGKIRISSALIGDSVRISINDDGPGVNETDLHRVFEPFFTTKEDGTGLGLSLSRKIIRENGGDMWVSSTKSCGATFTIELPVVADTTDPEESSSSDDSGMKALSRSVLIVDDEDHITELVESVLQRCGYRTDRLNEGAPAIELLKKKKYDILICDLHMPGTNGRDLIEWVRLNRRDTRVLLLSGDIARSETQEFVRTCGAHFLAKPFSVSELRKAVHRLSS
ncbi:MAG TPA: hybrid sensor histidine kinase/response regulator [Terriglobia bacterium]|nr:hybrid sensor histidine kinase/response regulator [Terriglobia bacterium]